MNKIQLWKYIFWGTILSILIFLSISFITVLTQINPLHYYQKDENYHFDIGFPFEYYSQFWIKGSDIPNSGWNLKNLFYDCFLCWIIVTGLYVMKQLNNFQNQQKHENQPNPQRLH
jgi:hypothetical protein